MAVQNSLLKQDEKKKSLVMEFKAGDENVKLSPKIVKSYLVSGDAEKVTDQEVMMFMMLCKNQHLTAASTWPPCRRISPPRSTPRPRAADRKSVV